MSADPEVLIAALDQKNAHAARLAMLASAAMQIEPELLRALRLRIPKADAGAEADLWFSELVESRSTLGMTLRADVRETLQEELALDRAALDAVAEVLFRLHANVSDVIRIEEQVTLECLRSEPGAKDRIDALLAPLVATLESQPHRGLARWAIRAFDAMPQLAKETQSVWRLMRSSSVTRAASGTAPTPTPVEAALSDLPKRTVRLRLRKDALEIEAGRRGRVAVGGINSAAWRDTVSDALRAQGFDVVIPEDALPIAGERGMRQILDSSDGYVSMGGPTGWIDQPRRYANERGLPVLDLIDEARLPGIVSNWAARLGPTLLSQKSGTEIEIPDTVPLMLEVAWDDNGRQSRRITMQPGETIHQPLRPRNVTVSTFNGEMFALEPELELEDYAIVIGIDRYEYSDVVAPNSAYTAGLFRDWLLAPDGGRIRSENVRDVRTQAELYVAVAFPRKTRRVYAYFAGATQDSNRLLLEDGSIDANEFREGLRRNFEEVVLVIESAWDRTPDFARTFEAGTNELILVNNVREGALMPQLLEALSGAAANESGIITATSVAQYVQLNRPTLLWTWSADFVLRKNVFTTASLHFPREMFGAEMQLTPEQGEPQQMQIADGVQLIVRPAKYELAVPEYAFYRTLTFRPGHNDVSLGWRFNGKWVIVAGTANPRLTEEQRLICEAIARSLADHGFGLFVGSYLGVDELAARVFVDRVHFLGGGATEVFRQYVLASSTPQFEAARTVTVEDDFEGPLSEASALIVIGGARGTFEYVRRANERQLRVFAVEGTGGFADEIATKSPTGLPINPETAPKIAQSIVETIEGVTPIWVRRSPPDQTQA